MLNNYQRCQHGALNGMDMKLQEVSETTPQIGGGGVDTYIPAIMGRPFNIPLHSTR